MSDAPDDLALVQTIRDACDAFLTPDGPEEQDAPEIDAAMRALAAGLLDKLGLDTPDADALRKAQRVLAVVAGAVSEEEPQPTWTEIHRLAAVTGEALRHKHGRGAWRLRRDGFGGPVPLAFTLDSLQVNVYQRAIGWFEEGEALSPVWLLDHDPDAKDDDAPVRFALRPADYAEAAQIYSRPLLPSDGAQDPLALVVCLVHDLPAAVSYLKPDLDGRPLPELELEATAGLRQDEVEVTEVPNDLGQVLLVAGSYYASEKLLDHAFLTDLSRRLSADTLALAVPERGVLVVGDMPAIAAVVQAARSGFEGAAPSRRLSPTVILWKDAEYIGIARPSTSSDPWPAWVWLALGALAAAVVAWWTAG